MQSCSTKQCAACKSKKDLTKHHMYPRYLRDIWRGRFEQVILILCHTCHAAVHYRGGRKVARLTKQHDFVRRFCDPALQLVIGHCRRIIRELERDSKALHTGNSR